MRKPEINSLERHGISVTFHLFIYANFSTPRHILILLTNTRNELLIHAVTWRILQSIRMSKRSHTQKGYILSDSINNAFWKRKNLKDRN